MTDARRADDGPHELVPRSLRVMSEWAWRSLVILLAVSVILWAAAYINVVIVPLIVALMASALLEPIRARFRSWGMSDGVASVLAFLVGLVLVGGVLALTISQFASNFDDLSNRAGDGLGKISKWLSGAPFHIKANRLQAGFEDWIDKVRSDPTRALSGTFSLLSTTTGLLAGGLLAIISTLFIMKDRHLMWGSVSQLVPRDNRPAVDRGARAAWAMLVSYVQVTLISATFDSLAIGSAAAIAGVPASIALGALVFLSAFIPTVGAIVSGLLVVLVALVASGPTTALALAIVVLVVQQLDANVLYPMMAKRKLAMHPLLALLLVAAGGVAAGIVGAFIAVPTAAMAGAVIGALRDPDAGERELVDELTEPALDGGDST